MPTRVHPRQPRSTPRPPPPLRPWPALLPQARLQLAQQMAHLLRRFREEARHAERAR
jgi:hypothetical protein